MSHLPFSDREVERVLAGQQPYGRPELAEVAYFVARLRTSTDFETPPEMSPELRAQVEAAEARQLQRAGGRQRRSRRRQDRDAMVPDEALDVIRLRARHAAADQGRRRWPLVGAAAAALVVGVVATVALLGGGAPEPEVEAQTAGTAFDPTTTTTTAPTTTGSDAPAASSADPTRPTVPAQPPDSRVDTTQVPAEPGGANDPSDRTEPPPWAEDFWPSECDWEDWECACDELEEEHGRDVCQEFMEQNRRGDDRRP